MKDILTLLQRDDKHFVGGGNRLLWAPPFPVFLDAPGFWDTAHYYNYAFGPLFTWTLLDDEGSPLVLRPAGRAWDPSGLTQTFAARLAHGLLTATERKSVLPGDVAASSVALHLRGTGKARLHLVAWTAQDHYPSGHATWITEPSVGDGTVSFTRHLAPPGRPPAAIGLVFGLSRKARSYVLQLSEGSSPAPRWDQTPMYEKFLGRRLPDSMQLAGVNEEGIVYAALHTPLVVSAGRPETVTIAMGVAPTIEESRRNAAAALKAPSAAVLSRDSWTEHFDGVPHFSCSDPFIERFYWYRWYGLRLNTLAGGEGNYPHPTVCEGIEYFRMPIAYSAPCHILENRWRHDPALARGCLLTFIGNQREDGAFPGAIEVAHERKEMFYHANWGRALTAIQSVHPSAGFLREAYEGLSRYARYFDKERDEEVSGLYDIDNQYETGQEYMHRYTAVDPEADRDNWGKVFRLKGVDATVYIYELKRALAAAARELHKSGEAELWEIEADKIRHAVLSLMWDPAHQMFFDVDPATGARTLVKAATCFYPYFTDMVTADHVDGLKQHLLQAAEFWSPYPAPSTSMDDETFCDEPEWKGKRMNCPWNGRVWPMTNSHLAEALARTAVAFADPLLRRKTAEFITRFVHMMFTDGDPRRPNSFEHYNPLTGKASVYRGIDDYQHSWVVDLIISYVCGIRAEADGLVIDPFPFGLDRASIDNVMIRGHRIRVTLAQKTYTVWVDGVRSGSGSIGTPLRLPLA